MTVLQIGGGRGHLAVRRGGEQLRLLRIGAERRAEPDDRLLQRAGGGVAGTIPLCGHARGIAAAAAAAGLQRERVTRHPACRRSATARIVRRHGVGGRRAGAGGGGVGDDDRAAAGLAERAGGDRNVSDWPQLCHRVGGGWVWKRDLQALPDIIAGRERRGAVGAGVVLVTTVSAPTVIVPPLSLTIEPSLCSVPGVAT